MLFPSGPRGARFTRDDPYTVSAVCGSHRVAECKSVAPQIVDELTGKWSDERWNERTDALNSLLTRLQFADLVVAEDDERLAISRAVPKDMREREGSS